MSLKQAAGVWVVWSAMTAIGSRCLVSIRPEGRRAAEAERWPFAGKMDEQQQRAELMDGGWRRAADFLWSMVTKEGKREGKLRGMMEFIQEGSIDVKLPRGKMRDSFKCQINTHDWFCSMQRSICGWWKWIRQTTGWTLFGESSPVDTHTILTIKHKWVQQKLKYFSKLFYFVLGESAEMFELCLACEYVISGRQMFRDANCG